MSGPLPPNQGYGNPGQNPQQPMMNPQGQPNPQMYYQQQGQHMMPGRQMQGQPMGMQQGQVPYSQAMHHQMQPGQYHQYQQQQQQQQQQHMHQVGIQMSQPGQMLPQQASHAMGQPGPQQFSVANPQMVNVGGQHHQMQPSPMMSGGPQSVNPGSIGPPSHQMAPGSQQMAPGSQQMAPGSQQMTTGPASIGGPHSQQMAMGPSSVQAANLGPGSQQMMNLQGPHTPQNPASHAGMHSISATNPASVQPATPASNMQPSSMQGLQRPASVQPATPVQSTPHQPMTPATGEKLMGQPQSVSSTVTGSAGQTVKEESAVIQEAPLIQDPVASVKSMILADLRRKIIDLNKKSCDVIKANASSGGVSPEQVAAYKQAHNDFMAVCDQIDSTLTLICEFRQQMSKLDKIFPPLQQGQPPQPSQPLPTDQPKYDQHMLQQINNFIEYTNSTQKMFSDTIFHVTDTVQKVRDRQDAYAKLNGADAEADGDVPMVSEVKTEDDMIE
ncbi:hypothetical protein WR25_17824 isoform A [Diploscapter pachys]|uniref:Mediator of RNA polymerase II transcription subunit 29 n=1 Tax=Diploscapter pachys TaxID=2018661 RepID=A0A2A2KN94_9BILA|nr:hypothetical protein WR25_17824 isoform A [Diploscapter pachys]